MKGTEKIVAQIKTEAEKKASELLQAAEESCARIRQEYEQKARDSYTEKIRAGVSAGQERLEKLQSEKLEESRREIEALRAQLVDEVFVRAAEKLECSPQELTEKLRAELSEKIESILFD